MTMELTPTPDGKEITIPTLKERLTEKLDLLNKPSDSDKSWKKTPSDDKPSDDKPWKTEDTPPSDDKPSDDKKDISDQDKKYFNKEDLKNFVPQARFNKIYARMKEAEAQLASEQESFDKKLKSLSDEDKEYRNDLKKQGFVPEDEKEILAQKKEINKLNKEIVQEIEKDLEEMVVEFNGDNGLPKFEKEAVIQHGLDNNIMNPKVAYKDLYFAEIVDFYVNKAIEEAKKDMIPKFTKGESEKKPEIGKPKDIKLGTSKFKDYMIQKVKSLQS